MSTDTFWISMNSYKSPGLDFPQLNASLGVNEFLVSDFLFLLVSNFLPMVLIDRKTVFICGWQIFWGPYVVNFSRGYICHKNIIFRLKQCYEILSSGFLLKVLFSMPKKGLHVHKIFSSITFRYKIYYSTRLNNIDQYKIILFQKLLCVCPSSVY